MIKKLKNLRLPLEKDKEVIIFLQDGTKARTYPKRIDEVSIEEGQILVTFTTRNSVYQVSFVSKDKEPQVIKPGELIYIQIEDGYMTETIEEIIYISKEKIQIRTESGIYEGYINI